MQPAWPRRGPVHSTPCQLPSFTVFDVLLWLKGIDYLWNFQRSLFKQLGLYFMHGMFFYWRAMDTNWLSASVVSTDFFLVEIGRRFCFSTNQSCLWCSDKQLHCIFLSAVMWLSELKYWSYSLSDVLSFSGWGNVFRSNSFVGVSKSLRILLSTRFFFRLRLKSGAPWLCVCKGVLGGHCFHTSCITIKSVYLVVRCICGVVVCSGLQTGFVCFCAAAVSLFLVLLTLMNITLEFWSFISCRAFLQCCNYLMFEEGSFKSILWYFWRRSSQYWNFFWMKLLIPPTDASFFGLTAHVGFILLLLLQIWRLPV